MTAVVFTAITMIRGEEDISFASLTYHARIGFDRIIVISHVEFEFLRRCVGTLRGQFPETQFHLIEISEASDFSKKKGGYINRALSKFVRSDDINIAYGFDADEFIGLGKFGNIRDLFDAYRDFTGTVFTDPSCTPSLLTLPWKNLIIDPDSSIGAEVSAMSDRILSSRFFELERIPGSAKKVVFLKRPNVRLHMGFHWVWDNVERTKLKSAPKSNQFVQKFGLGVYHFPLRSIAQLKTRIKVYQASAASSEKYNRIGASLCGTEGDDALKDFFECATSPEPRFASLEDAQIYFGDRFPVREIGPFKPFLIAPRRFVGAVLSPAAQGG